jgi:tRNA pseudouridine(55) synthase
MILLINKGTKISSEFIGLPKEYIALLKFGIQTDTWDLDGKVIRKEKVQELNKNILNNILGDFKGRLRQLPPMYSSVKHGGKPLYRFARMGVEIKRNYREIEIYNMDILGIERNLLILKIKCSAGTYIRSLANDMGETYGTGAALAGLIRTDIGDFKIEHARSIKEMIYMAKLNKVPVNERGIMSLGNLFDKNPSVYVRKENEKRIIDGSPLRTEIIDTDSKKLSCFLNELRVSEDNLGRVIAIRSLEGNIIALHRLKKGLYIEDTKSFNKNFTENIVIF